MIDVMDGRQPRRSTPTPACRRRATPRRAATTRACAGDGPRRYYEPDASDGEDGPGYSPRPGGERGHRAALERGARLHRPARSGPGAVQAHRPRRPLVRRVRQPRCADPGQPARATRRSRRTRPAARRSRRRPTDARRRPVPRRPRRPPATTRRLARPGEPHRARRRLRQRVRRRRADRRGPGRPAAPARCARPSGWPSTSRRAGPRPATASPAPPVPSGMGYYTFSPQPRGPLHRARLDRRDAARDGGNLDPRRSSTGSTTSSPRPTPRAS